VKLLLLGQEKLGEPEEQKRPEKSSLLFLFFPDTCRKVGTAIAAAVGRVYTHPVSPSCSRNNLFSTHCHPCLYRSSGSSSHPGFAEFRNGRSSLCYAAAPAACSPGE